MTRLVQAVLVIAALACVGVFAYQLASPKPQTGYADLRLGMSMDEVNTSRACRTPCWTTSRQAIFRGFWSRKQKI